MSCHDSVIARRAVDCWPWCSRWISSSASPMAKETPEISRLCGVFQLDGIALLILSILWERVILVRFHTVLTFQLAQELTSQKFVSFPGTDAKGFTVPVRPRCTARHRGTVAGAKATAATVFRSGDLVRLTQHSALQCLGRMDHQVLRRWSVEISWHFAIGHIPGIPWKYHGMPQCLQQINKSLL